MSLTVSPASLTFPPTAVGPDCPGDNCTHADVTITGASCTFQWGFKPQKPGQRRDTGQVTFESGAAVSIDLEGRGTPH